MPENNEATGLILSTQHFAITTVLPTSMGRRKVYITARNKPLNEAFKLDLPLLG
ncbi:MAG: hypothetical protein KME59_10595 [Trichormus sp. ATA11-4-KO1]|jgi:hypothetical protein|nr:hypothetical protein [Trichormus sp. ATA11-4-KO1]